MATSSKTKLDSKNTFFSQYIIDNDGNVKIKPAEIKGTKTGTTRSKEPKVTLVAMGKHLDESGSPFSLDGQYLYWYGSSFINLKARPDLQLTPKEKVLLLRSNVGSITIKEEDFLKTLVPAKELL